MNSTRMIPPQNDYIPGVCNIGKAEIKMRRALGWLGLIATVLLWALFIAMKTPAPWRLTLFVPAFLAAMGYLQAAWHFCAKFGLGGVFNFGPSIGRTDTVEQAEYRKQDRRTALQIVGVAALFGAVVAAVASLSPV
jgi:hypothetical protein